MGDQRLSDFLIIPTFYQIQANASIVYIKTNEVEQPLAAYSKILNIPQSANFVGRVLSFKEIRGSSISFFGVSTILNNPIEGYETNPNISSLGCLTIQASTSNWFVHNRYDGFSTSLLYLSTDTIPLTAEPVYMNTQNSICFLDSRTQEKVVVLPEINTISPLSNTSFFVTIKDVYGKANVHNFYISTSAGNLLESDGSQEHLLQNMTSMRIADNFASIDLVASSKTNSWYIMNYYNGNKVLSYPSWNGPAAPPPAATGFTVTVLNAGTHFSRISWSPIITIPPLLEYNVSSNGGLYWDYYYYYDENDSFNFSSPYFEYYASVGVNTIYVRSSNLFGQTTASFTFTI